MGQLRRRRRNLYRLRGKRAQVRRSLDREELLVRQLEDGIDLNVWIRMKRLDQEFGVRTIEKAQELAKEFGGVARSLKNIEEIKNMDIIFNATSIGLHPKENHTSLPKELITNKHIIFDAIYIPYETRLLKEGKQQGARIIHGMEMLLQQGIAQFKLYTGYDAPEKTMRDVLPEYLNQNEK